MQPSLFTLGVLVCALGLLPALVSIPALLRGEKLLRLPMSTIAASQGKAVVKLRGTVVALDQKELITAPFSNRRAVWARSAVYPVGHRSPRRAVEQVLCPGDTITVVGPSRRSTAPPVSEGYRSALATELVLSSNGPDDPLIVAAMSEADLASKRASGARASLTLLAAGAVMMLADILWNGHWVR